MIEIESRQGHPAASHLLGDADRPVPVSEPAEVRHGPLRDGLGGEHQRPLEPSGPHPHGIGVVAMGVNECHGPAGTGLQLRRDVPVQIGDDRIWDDPQREQPPDARSGSEQSSLRRFGGYVLLEARRVPEHSGGIAEGACEIVRINQIAVHRDGLEDTDGQLVAFAGVSHVGEYRPVQWLPIGEPHPGRPPHRHPSPFPSGSC